MKKTTAIITAVIFMSVIATPVFAIDLEYVRQHYEQAVKNENLCQTLIDQLSKETENPVCLAYLGAFQTIWANHVNSPLSKLSTFNKGKKNIEQALKKAPDNIELRFIRLSVQVNCPDFLQYNSNINEDKKFIRSNINQIDSKSLKAMCYKLI